jgi:hypothetical protein
MLSLRAPKHGGDLNNLGSDYCFDIFLPNGKCHNISKDSFQSTVVMIELSNKDTKKKSSKKILQVIT